MSRGKRRFTKKASSRVAVLGQPPKIHTVILRLRWLARKRTQRLRAPQVPGRKRKKKMKNKSAARNHVRERESRWRS